jgi:hypothetical protein
MGTLIFLNSAEGSGALMVSRAKSQNSKIVWKTGPDNFGQVERRPAG